MNESGGAAGVSLSMVVGRGKSKYYRGGGRNVDPGWEKSAGPSGYHKSMGVRENFITID